MKAVYAAAVLIGMSTLAQDINFTNRTATFTNLQGESFSSVELVRGDLDGVIWRKDSSGGRVCYTNLNLLLLEAWGIPTNRIEIARARAERKAMSAAQARAWALKRAQMDAAAKAKADAEQAALGPLKARAEAKTADANAIVTLARQIEIAKAQLRWAEAAAHDYNAANMFNDYAPHVYVKEGERVKVEEAEARLEKMRAEFALKYKDNP